MFENNKFDSVIETVDLLRAELREVKSGRLHFRVIHRHRLPGTDCMPGEEVLAVLLVHRGHEYQLRLSPAQLLLVDYLLRHSRYAQTASQIATGIHTSEFYSEHGMNGRQQRIQRISRSAIKEYMRRLRLALARAFREAKLRVKPSDVLVAKESMSNHLLYRWQSDLEVIHFDSAADDTEDSAICT